MRAGCQQRCGKGNNREERKEPTKSSCFLSTLLAVLCLHVTRLFIESHAIGRKCFSIIDCLTSAFVGFPALQFCSCFAAPRKQH